MTLPTGFPKAISHTHPDFSKMTFEEQSEFIVTADLRPRRQLSRSPYAHKGVLHILSVDPDEDTRIAVANNRNTSDVTLNRLALGKNGTDLQYAVACNPNTQGRTLVVLGHKNRETVVRSAVMEHPNCPEELSRQLMAELRRY